MIRSYFWKVRRSLTSLNGEKDSVWGRFAVQVLPPVILVGLSQWIAYMSTPASTDSTFILIVAAITGLLVIATLTFRERHGWNLWLLLGSSVGSGSTISLLTRGTNLIPDSKPFLIVLVCLALGASTRKWFGVKGSELSVILWLVSWVYLSGWVALRLLRLDLVLYVTWSIVGVALFTGISGVWFATMADEMNKRSSVSLAIDLYVIGINLFLAGMTLFSVSL